MVAKQRVTTNLEVREGEALNEKIYEKWGSLIMLWCQAINGLLEDYAIGKCQPFLDLEPAIIKAGK